MNRATKNDSWVQNPDGTLGWTSSPITGCLNRTPEGLCLGGMFPCFAWTLANGRLRSRYLANKNVVSCGDACVTTKLSENWAEDPFYPRLWPERIEELDHKLRTSQKPLGVFLCIMGEWAGDWVPESWQNWLFELMRRYPQHRFYLLTKQPQNLVKFSPFPPNCYVGVSVTSNGAMTLALTNLANIKAGKRFISFEPLLGSIGMSDHMSMKGIIDGVIIGSQTKPTVFPKIEWVQEIALAATKAHIPLFLKENLRPLLPNRMPFYAVYSYWSGDKTHKLYKNRLRQEMPDVG